MKKQLILLIMMLSAAVNALAVEVEIDGLWYELISKIKEAKVIKYKNDKKYRGSIVIPESIDYEGLTYNVTSIGENAFEYCSSLTSITIPRNVVAIEGGAFFLCNYLTSVHISDLSTWCKIAFTDQESNPLQYAHHIFLCGEELKDLVIPDDVTVIKDYSFSGCSSLNSITIPSSVTSIGDVAFFGCSGLASITIPNSVMSIGAQSFSGCENLISVYITDLESWCKTYFGDNPLKYAQKLLLNGNEVTEMVIPENVTSINANAFAGYKGLVSVVLPDSLTTIGVGAFSGCSGLTSIIIPNSVTSIEWFAFQGCINITTIIIGTGLKVIYERAFANCLELTDVYCFAVDVPSMLQAITNKPCTNAFEYSYIDYATLHVPIASIDSYKSTKPWSDFKNIVKIDLPKHTLTYIIDGETYKTNEKEEGETIIPEPTPTKEGYTFSGWSDIPATMPAHDVTVTGTFTINNYKLTYTVDGVKYKSYEVEYGATIMPEPALTKEGYTFSGWSEIPQNMPAHDVTVTGTFSINKYKLTYTVDGEEYKSYDVEYGASITPEAEPTKEGYTFSGWSEIPQTMPAKDVTVTGTFSINKYKLTYTVDGKEYKCYDVEYGATITREADPTKEGYTFSGWSEIPETMPAHDVIVIGTFNINSYKLTYMIDDMIYKEMMYEYGATITPEPQPEGNYLTFEWIDLPQTMPAHDVVVYASYTSGIIEVLWALQHKVRIYSPTGKKLDKLQKGLNIVTLNNGIVKKIIIP